MPLNMFTLYASVHICLGNVAQQVGSEELPTPYIFSQVLPKKNIAISLRNSLKTFFAKDERPNLNL